MPTAALRADGVRGHLPSFGSATRTVARVLGAVAAFAGAEHGVGEMTQADPQPAPGMIESWPHVSAFEPLSGEPAMTLIPDIRVAGLVTLLVAVSLGWWAVRGEAAHRDGWAFLGFSALLLLVGGGFGPPLVTVALGVTLLLPAHGGRPARPMGSVRRALGRRWQQLLLLTVGAFLALFPGVVLLDWLAGTETVWLAAVLPLIAFTGLVLTLIAARAHDFPGARALTER